MPRRIDVSKIRQSAYLEVVITKRRFDDARKAAVDFWLLRWISAMSAVELQGTWERFAELRLVAALCHNPVSFLTDHEIRGIATIPLGLSKRLIRGNGKYFDFRSVADLKGISSRFLADSVNPFRNITKTEEAYLDTLAAIRNVVAHGSDSSAATYRKSLAGTYGIKATPTPDEFLNAIDYRRNSPARGCPRLHGLIQTLQVVIARI